MSQPAATSTATSTSARAFASTYATSSSSSTTGAAARTGKRKTYIEENLAQLQDWFGQTTTATPASTSNAATSPLRGLDAAGIRAAYSHRRDDMQKTIDDLVERTGLHPELHSRASNTEQERKEEPEAYSSSSSTPVSSTLKKQKSSRLVFEQKQGDLFSCEPHSALAHCVSECLAMGKGVATLFKSKFGGIAELKMQKKPVGDVAVLNRGGRFVYYLITKPRYFHKPTMATLEQSLIAMRNHMRENGVKLLSMPRIGCGLDGLLWNDVAGLIKRVFEEDDVRVVIYTI